jgi:transposase
MTYIPSYKDQAWLLPPAIEDLIPEDHLCFLVEALVDAQDYSDFDLRYSGAGPPAYHPRILVKLLVMGIMERGLYVLGGEAGAGFSDDQRF